MCVFAGGTAWVPGGHDVFVLQLRNFGSQRRDGTAADAVNVLARTFANPTLCRGEKQSAAGHLDDEIRNHAALAKHKVDLRCLLV